MLPLTSDPTSLAVLRALRQAAASDCLCGWQAQGSHILSWTPCLEALAEKQLPDHYAFKAGARQDLLQVRSLLR